MPQSRRQELGQQEQKVMAVRKTAKGLALKRWFKEDWRTPRGKKGYSGSDRTFRPTKRISSDTPATWSELTPAQRKELGQRGGVLVVASTDAAARAGIREGDVILQLGNTLVPDVGAFESALSKADKSKPLGLLVRRGELAQILVIRPDRP